MIFVLGLDKHLAPEDLTFTMKLKRLLMQTSENQRNGPCTD